MLDFDDFDPDELGAFSDYLDGGGFSDWDELDDDFDPEALQQSLDEMAAIRFDMSEKFGDGDELNWTDPFSEFFDDLDLDF